MYLTFNSIGIETIIVIFHGLSKLTRRIKARIKKCGGESSVLGEKSGLVGSYVLLSDLDSTSGLDSG